MHPNFERKELESLILSEFIKVQSQSGRRLQAAKEVDKSGAVFPFSKVCIVIPLAAMDGALQNLVSQSMRQRVVYISHHLPLAGYPGQQDMYDTMCRNYY